MKPKRRNNDPEFYRKCGVRGAKARWLNHEHQNDEKSIALFNDRKGEYYGAFVRKDGVTITYYHSMNRKDQLDGYEDDVMVCRVSKRTIGDMIFELV